MKHEKNVVMYARAILVDHMFGSAYGGNNTVINRLKEYIPAQSDSMNSNNRCPHLKGYYSYSHNNTPPPAFVNGWWAPTEELPPGVRVDNEEVIASMCKVVGTAWLANPTKNNNTTKDVNYLRDVVTDLPALLTWCHTVLSDGSKPRPLTRFPKMPDVQALHGMDYEEGRAYPLQYIENLADGTTLWLWENYQNTAKLPFKVEAHSAQWRSHNHTMLVLLGELSAAPVINRKVSSAEVREYVANLADFVRAHPIVAGLLVTDHATDDSYVQWFLVGHSNWGEAVHNYDSSRYQATWQNAMVNAVAKQYAEERTKGPAGDVALLTKIKASVAATEYAMDRLLTKGIPLEATKELITAFHNKLVDTDNGIAAELSLGKKDRLLTQVGLRAMAVAGFADKESLVKMIATRIKQSNAEYFQGIPQ